LWWTDESGRREEVGTLTYLANDSIHIQSRAFGDFQGASLPWYLSPLRAEGFLGRLAARRLVEIEVDPDPERWPIETILFAALQVHDAPGALTLGLQSTISQPIRLQPRALKAGLDTAASAVAETLPAGSSAGGEQPKFLALLQDGQHIIVKFTPPLRSPGGKRWSDLLECECLASEILNAHGIAAAKSQIIRTAQRTYLISPRFDRIGTRGRRHVVPIGKVHEAFVQGAYRNWAESASALALAGRITSREAEEVKHAREFGHLIGNADMHSGNLGLFVHNGDIRRGRFELAPIYDMLPMRYRPNALHGGADEYAPFTPEAIDNEARSTKMALDFWKRVAEKKTVSTQMRRLAVEMAARIRS
jgi:hypothetical protein